MACDRSSCHARAMSHTPGPPMDHLPPDPVPFGGVVANTYAESTPDWPPPVRPPAGAPNIVLIMVDDLGFGQLSSFGGPIEAPHLSELAANGLAVQTTSTPLRCARRAARHCSRAATTTRLVLRRLPRWPAASLAPTRSCRDRRRRSPRLLRQTGYATYCAGKWHPDTDQRADRCRPVRSLAARSWVSSGSMDSFLAKSTSGHPIMTVDNHRIETPTQGPSKPGRVNERLPRQRRHRRRVHQDAARPTAGRLRAPIFPVSPLRRTPLSVPCAARIHRPLRRTIR